MEIEKIWINNDSKGHNIICFNEQIIYRAQIPDASINEVRLQLSRGKISDRLIGIPLGYLSKVKYRKDDSKIKLHYGKKSEDEIHVENTDLRKEIFDYIHYAERKNKLIVKKPSIWSRIKKPFIALAFLSAFFAYTYSIIDGINQGYQYEIVGAPGFLSLALPLAELGLVKNILIFAPLAVIAIWRIVSNYNNDSDVYTLHF